MKKYIIFIVLFLGLAVSEPVFATQGALKSNSIQRCGGNTYGNHGDGHWHHASKSSENGRWYPQGESLGHANPCGIQSKPKMVAQQKQQVSQKPSAADVKRDAKRKERERKEAKRIEDARIAKEKEAAKRKEAKRKEAERKEKERKEKERIAKEKRENTKVTDVKVHKGSQTTMISGVPMVKHFEDIEVTLENPKASYQVTSPERLEPFQNVEVVVSVKSEDKSKTENYSYQYFILGTQEELIAHDALKIKFKDHEFQLLDGQFESKQKFVKLSDDIELYVGNHKLPTASSHTLIKKQEGYTYQFKLSDTTYEIPLKEASDSISSYALVGLAVPLSVGGVALHRKKYRKKSKERD